MRHEKAGGLPGACVNLCVSESGDVDTLAGRWALSFECAVASLRCLVPEPQDSPASLEFGAVTLNPAPASAERSSAAPAPTREEWFTIWWCRRVSGAEEQSAQCQVGEGWVTGEMRPCASDCRCETPASVPRTRRPLFSVENPILGLAPPSASSSTHWRGNPPADRIPQPPATAGCSGLKFSLVLGACQPLHQCLSAA